MDTSEQLLSTPQPRTPAAVPLFQPAQWRWQHWLPVALWIACISFFSTDSFSAEHTGSILNRVLTFMFGPIANPYFFTIHFMVRKTAHFVVYMILSILAYRSSRKTFPSPFNWQLRWALLAIVVVFATASLDEWHQSFVPSRTASPKDVAIDMAGGMFAQLFIVAFTRMQMEPRRS